MPVIWKSTFREIRQSLGRFMAILAIVALGVSLFSGLKVVRDCMVKTTNAYLAEHNFYDYRLLSTVGFAQEELEELKCQEDVKAAEGAVSLDILCRLDKGSEMVLKMYSLPERVNQLKVIAGRLPEKETECVVDSNLCSAQQIGKKLILAPDNTEEDLEQFAYTEYTIVGLVQSPLYIQFERGNTSLGNGRLSGFAYLSQEGFATDYYTEVYVKFAQDFEIYSEEYDLFLEEKEAYWEQLTQDLTEDRFVRVREEAEADLAEAEKELAEGQTEGEEELAEALQKLEDARIELEDGEAELAEAEEELQDALATLAEKEAELQDARDRLDRETKKLEDGEAELEKNLKLWQEQEALFQEKQGELASGQAEMTKQSAVIAQKEAELSAGWAQLNEAKQQLASQEKTLNATEAELLALLPGLPEGEEKEQLLEGLKQIPGYREQIAAGKMELAAAEAQLQEGQAALDGGKATISEYQAQMADGSSQLAAGKEELDKAYQQLMEGKRQLAEGRAELYDARLQLADGNLELIKGRQELADGQKELEEARAELADGRSEYEEGLQEYEDGRREFEEEIADAKEQIADAREALAKMEELQSYVLGRETNVGYVCFENDSGIVDGIADVFPVFFFAVAALVCITTMNRMVEEQRTQIGVLKALGYGQRTIMGKYLFYSGTAAAIGCITGYAFGIVFFPKVIWFAYSIMYSVGSLQLVFNIPLAIISLAVSLLCSMGATWVSCRYELSEVAAQLMRPKAPKTGQRVFLERVPLIWKRLKFLHKVSIRNVFRYKKRFFMMVIGISGCTALLVTGFGINDSVVHVADHQYDRIQIYDMSVNSNEQLTKEHLEQLGEVLEGKVTGYTPVLEASAELVTQDAVKALYLVAAEPESFDEYVDLHTDSGEKLVLPEEGKCIISQNLAEEFHIVPGDQITVRDDEMRELVLEVAGIHVNYISRYVYLSTQTYEKLMGEPAPCKTLYLNRAPETDGHRLSAALMREDMVTSVSINDDMRDRLNSMLGSMDLLILVIILCAAGLAFIVLYNLTNINITERIREIATIKVLGFYRKETSSYVFRENLVLTMIGALAGLVLGKGFHAFVMSAITIDMVSFDVQVSGPSYLYSVALTVVFAMFVNWFMGKKLENISMTESLKSVD